MSDLVFISFYSGWTTFVGITLFLSLSLLLKRLLEFQAIHFILNILKRAQLLKDGSSHWNIPFFSPLLLQTIKWYCVFSPSSYHPFLSKNQLLPTDENYIDWYDFLNRFFLLWNRIEKSQHVYNPSLFSWNRFCTYRLLVEDLPLEFEFTFVRVYYLCQECIIHFFLLARNPNEVFHNFYSSLLFVCTYYTLVFLNFYVLCNSIKEWTVKQMLLG